MLPSVPEMPEPKSPTESSITLHQLMLPEHANALGNVHGGVIMRMVDEAGAICAMRHARIACVTIAIDSMTFRQPVHLGDLLVCAATVTWVGRTSIEVGVTVHAENPVSPDRTRECLPSSLVNKVVNRSGRGLLLLRSEAYAAQSCGRRFR
jgi:uncharacterized protein (TIGR00369 family)